MTPKAVAIAAGGGGDAITSAIVASKLCSRFDVVAIMSYSWDRLLTDPTPGPRSFADFTGLIEHSTLVREITESAQLRMGGRSTLPGLVPHLACPLLLLDPSAGAVGLAAQICRAAEVFRAELVVVVDTGGDVLAEGHEAGLRSPLADSLALAAAVRSGIPATLLVAGVGLDGELSPPELYGLLKRHGATVAADLGPADVSTFGDVWSWHPSEANGLVAAAAGGWRGTVETQRNTLLQVNDDATAVSELGAEAVASQSLAHVLGGTTSLDLVEQLIRDHRGHTDIDVERDRLITRPKSRMPDSATLSQIDRYASGAADRGINALTLRRVFELSAATGIEATTALRELLRSKRASRMRPPLYLV